MVQDHAKANDRLSSLAKAANIPLPGDLDPDHRTMRADLEKLSGAPFDWAYIQGQVQDHQKTAHLLEWEIGSGQDAELQKFASETLPVVFQHLQLAQSIAAQLAGGSAQAAAQPPAHTGPSPQRSQPESRGSGSRR
jgi:putative membrane protein